MRKIVVGIIAVFFVQVGFQLYLAIERTNSEFASVEIAPRPNDVSNNVIPAGGFDQLSVTSYRSNETPYAAQKIRYVSEIRRQADPRASTTPVAREPRRGEAFKSAAIGPDIVITIPTPSTRPAYSSANTVVSSSVKSAKRRSFFSKSLHVLKKPYDWLKTVAMKLD